MSDLVVSSIPPPHSPRGHLKIFLGYAAGIGKSYAMLEAAHQRLAEGVDVVVGSVDTHHFVETETLLTNLEIIPKQAVSHRGTLYYQADVAALLDRNPQLVLIDDFAYTNPPGSRHLHRYQDIEELLCVGISVYTTLNIQSMESLKDMVYQITGVEITETIPNQAIDQADEIEVIDLPPEELQKRIQTGKVFIGEQNSPGMENFFRKGNLTALREIALRYAADRVDVQLRDYMAAKSIVGPWPVQEKILVVVSAHVFGERLVRHAHLFAERLGATWQVVYVETPQQPRYAALYSDQITRTLKLAEELGAKTGTISGSSIVKTIVDYAHQLNFTKIMVGKSNLLDWRQKFRRSVVKELIQNSGSMDVLVIQTSSPLNDEGAPHAPLKIKNYPPYLYSILIVLATTLVSLTFRPWLDPVNLVMPYLTVVVICAYFFGRGPSMLASLLGMLAFDFFFTEPHLTFTVADTQYLLTFLGLLVVGLTISNLTARVRDQMDAIQKKHFQTQTLFSLSRDLNTANGLAAILNTAIDHVTQTIGKKAVIFLLQDGLLTLSATSEGFQMDQPTRMAAELAYTKDRPTGQGTDIFFDADVRFQPLKTQQGILGVLGVELLDVRAHQRPEQNQLFEAFISLAAMAMQVRLSDEQSKENQLLRESERLKSVLLNSISHDLRTPLATITGALDSLKEAEQTNGQAIHLDQCAKLDLIQTASEESHRLNLLVQNLLDMSQLEAGALKLRRMETDMRDLISTAISHTQDHFQNRTIRVDIPEDLPGVSLDFILIEQVLVNIFDNAVKYSAPNTPIEITVRPLKDSIQIQIADRGVGIPPDSLPLVFDKFYRIEHENQVTGTGLGLSICKGITEAHGGQITAQNRPGGGTILQFTLPCQIERETVAYDK